VGIQADESDEILPDQHPGQGNGEISAIVVATECGKLCLWVVTSAPCKDSGIGFIGMKGLCIAEGLRFLTKMTGVR
jgi:hypothetical protein